MSKLQRIKHIIAVANSKGGVAKTSTCLGLACCTAEMGYSTLLIDLDHQANLSDDVGRGDEDYTISDLFAKPTFDINKIIYSALDQGQSIPNLQIIPADITLAVETRGAERVRHRLQILEDGLNRIKQDIDFCFIDCRPAIDLTVENAILIADMLVIPVNNDKRATKGINDLFEVTAEVKRTKDFKSLIVRTIQDQRKKVVARSISEEIESKNWNVANNVINVSEDFLKASFHGRPFTQYAVNSKQHNELRALTNEVLDTLGVNQKININKKTGTGYGA